MAIIPIETEPRHTNRLAGEKSPYLLQHAHNPVDWFPWDEEAFARARSEDKPIFLSIGYSTCHWCHVMERESFEDESVAAILNEHFVSIKVDREERPDVDKVYMTFVQAMTGQGGWPLNVFLTPDLKPFYGGTYFPPEPRHDRPSFGQLIEQVARVWQTRRDDVLTSAGDLHAKLQAISETSTPHHSTVTEEMLRSALARFKREYDPHHGGFGHAPKFPHPSQPAFVLREGVRFGDSEAIQMVLHTCTAMAAGGIHDQIGGGFSRYSVDAKWLVPHFEKMLYDNAQLVNLYLDAWLVSGDKAHADTARDILQYVLRDMTHPHGGFYSAEDADSEGKEGKFYCWTTDELAKLLSPEEYNVAVRYFGVTAAGNFIDHSDPNPLRGQNVLSVADSQLTADDRLLLGSAKRKMFDARSRRVRPHLDDKVLASWNGMMLGALARGYSVLRNQRYLDAAETNLRFLKTYLWDAETKNLFHRWRDGECDKTQLAEDYANVLAGVIELYQATLKSEHLEFAQVIADQLIGKFCDADEGGFWQGAKREDLVVRMKDEYDGAEPSSNSTAVLALFKLAAICDRNDFRTAAEKTLRHFAARLEAAPQAFSHMLLALDFWLHEPLRVAIVGELGNAATHALIHATHSVYQPNKVVLGTVGPVDGFTRNLRHEPMPVAYICSGNACESPVNERARLRELLQR